VYGEPEVRDHFVEHRVLGLAHGEAPKKKKLESPWVRLPLHVNLEGRLPFILHDVFIHRRVSSNLKKRRRSEEGEKAAKKTKTQTDHF